MTEITAAAIAAVLSINGGGGAGGGGADHGNRILTLRLLQLFCNRVERVKMRVACSVCCLEAC